MKTSTIQEAATRTKRVRATPRAELHPSEVTAARPGRCAVKHFNLQRSVSDIVVLQENVPSWPITQIQRVPHRGSGLLSTPWPTLSTQRSPKTHLQGAILCSSDPSQGWRCELQLYLASGWFEDRLSVHLKDAIVPLNNNNADSFNDAFVPVTRFLIVHAHTNTFKIFVDASITPRLSILFQLELTFAVFFLIIFRPDRCLDCILDDSQLLHARGRCFMSYPATSEQVQGC